MNPQTVNPNASCSEDQAAAQRLSRILRSPSGAVVSPPPVYTRLGGLAISGQEPTSAPPFVSRETGGWAGLLEEYAAYAGAQAAIIVDESGLLVAFYGDVLIWDEEKVGSWLTVAFDWADKMIEQRSRFLSLGIGDRTLTGLRLRAPGGEPLTLGLLNQTPLPKARLDELIRALEALEV